MKKMNLSFLFFATGFSLLSCGGSAQKNNSGNETAAASPGNSSPGTDAGFSYVLDGKEISGKGTDQNINAAFHLTGDDKGQIFFRLSDMKNVGDKLMFQVPGKIGSSTFRVRPGFSYAGYATSDFASYLDNPVTVTITSVSATNIAGTFSGTYTLSKGSGNANSKQTIEVKDGKFNIPFSTSAQWKQLYHAE